ncbi:MAG TPA: ATP-binding cassette domain-containing protein [Trebonia sp.]|nr:ATP-binding cassette domain-containing protein [Trebonia sp.]
MPDSDAAVPAPRRGTSTADVTTGETPVVELRNVSKHFGGVHAVVDVSLHVDKGEVVALVGNNGAGKSTIMRMISGIHVPDSGDMLVSGNRVRFRGPREAREAGIETVPQELALTTHLSVAANIFLGREVTRGWGPLQILDKKTMRQRSQELIRGFGIHIPDLGARVYDLSGGQQQGVAIGRALAWGSRMILLDEPTAALGIEETAQVERTVKSMRDEGVTVMLVSHNLDQVFRVADRVYVLRRGHLVGERIIAQTSEDDLVALITGLRGHSAGNRPEHDSPGGSADQTEGT